MPAPAAPGPVVSIDPHSDRATLWFNLFNRLDNIPVTAYTPATVDLPNLPGAQIYVLHMTRVAPKEREALIAYMRERFGLNRCEAELYLDSPGVIIYADDVTVSAPPAVVL
jgi:hypothetical protein